MAPIDLVVELRGVVIRGERILLVREKGGSAWSLPGGEADPGRAFSESLRERIVSETGMLVDVIRVIHSWDSPVESSQKHLLRLAYLCVPRSGRLKPGDGVKEVRWVDIGRVGGLPLSDFAREIIDSLNERFTLIIRNRDVKRILIGVPRGHLHKRVIIELSNGAIVLQEATVENLVRAFVEVEMHPFRRAIMLEGSLIKERKEGYSSYQLLEADLDESEVERIITDIVGSGEDDREDLKGSR